MGFFYDVLTFTVLTVGYLVHASGYAFLYSLQGMIWTFDVVYQYCAIYILYPDELALYHSYPNDVYRNDWMHPGDVFWIVVFSPIVVPLVWLFENYMDEPLDVY